MTIRKKGLAFIAILLVLSLFMLTACKDKNPSGGGQTGPSESVQDSTGGSQSPSDGPSENPPVEEPTELTDTTIYLVGDSTVCSFTDKYFYPRYGYGTQLFRYLNEKATVRNLAISGRSSKSFLAESNYQTLKNSIKEGDYLIIGFGHNDEKSDDPTRFTDASKPHTDPTSFGYHLNEYYVKLAKEAGATPILCTPVVRAAKDNDYSGSEAHVTSTGNYAQAIRDLGAAVGVAVIDLTAATAQRYAELGFDEACKYHAVTAGKYAADGTTVVPNMDTVDKTHLNIYGAKYVAYVLAEGLKNVNGISRYVLDEITPPTQADLVPIDGYVVPTYTAPNLENYSAPSHFATISDGWYGTAFGDTGGSPSSAVNGYYAKETSKGVFKVGNISSKNKGKFTDSSDGFAFLFRQVEADKNFTLSVSGTVLECTAEKNQVGFGLMLRDDVYINMTATDASITSNYVTAGLLTATKSSLNVNFLRENGAFNKGEQIASHIHAAGDTFTASIERVGQTVTVTVTYGGQTYTDTYYDFDFFAKDNGYMYVGMFSNRGTVVEFTDVVFTVTGTSQGA